MPVDPERAKPLDYAARTPRRRGSRAVVVALIGTLIALAGIGFFAAAHEMTDYDRLPAEHARMHELLWAALGIALLLAGAHVFAVGLGEWCRRDGG